MTAPDADWVCARAVAWVMDDAPVPADLIPALVAIARRCDPDGRGSRQTVATIAEKIGKSPKQAQRDVSRLREMGLIVPGDESLVAHLPPWRRPAVWDVPLGLRGAKPMKESKNRTGVKRGPTPMDGGYPLGRGTPHGWWATPSHGRGATHPHGRGTEKAFE